ncbi:MAG: hypothetical protein WCJ33_09985 [Pseudomonadota bacterium]
MAVKASYNKEYELALQEWHLISSEKREDTDRVCTCSRKVKNVNNMFNIKSDEVKSLQCGADHKKEYGTNGYDDTSHWCSKAYREFAKMGEENIDFNTCPKNWSLIEPKTNTYQIN